MDCNLAAFVSYWNLLLNKLKCLWVAFYDGFALLFFFFFFLIYRVRGIFTSAVSANSVWFWIFWNWTQVIPDILKIVKL